MMVPETRTFIAHCKTADEKLWQLLEERSRLITRLAETKAQLVRLENELARVEFEIARIQDHLKRFK